MALDAFEPLPDLPASADYCAVSTATRLLGDRWSLLLVREMFLGNTRFSEIHEALPGLSRGLLASRLGYLSRLGVVERRATDGSDLRVKYTYSLTESGRALGPVLSALGDWATLWLLPASVAENSKPAVDLNQLRSSFEPTALPVERMQIQFVLSDAAPVWLRADRTGVRVCRGTNEGGSDLVVRTSLDTLNRLYSGTRTCCDAVSRRDISFEGSPSYAQGFAGWFPHRPAAVGASSDDGRGPGGAVTVRNQDYSS